MEVFVVSYGLEFEGNIVSSVHSNVEAAMVAAWVWLAMWHDNWANSVEQRDDLWWVCDGWSVSIDCKEVLD